MAVAVPFSRVGLLVFSLHVLFDCAEAAFCFTRYCGGYVNKYCCGSRYSHFCCSYEDYYGHADYHSPVGAIVGAIFSLCVLIGIIALIICCCKATCPLYQRRYRGHVIVPGQGTVMTGGGAVVTGGVMAMTHHSGYVYPQQPNINLRGNYWYEPPQGYGYGAAAAKPPPYPGHYPPPPMYPGPPPAPTAVNTNPSAYPNGNNPAYSSTADSNPQR